MMTPHHEVKRIVVIFMRWQRPSRTVRAGRLMQFSDSQTFDWGHTTEVTMGVKVKMNFIVGFK